QQPGVRVARKAEAMTARRQRIESFSHHSKFSGRLVPWHGPGTIANRWTWHMPNVRPAQDNVRQQHDDKHGAENERGEDEIVQLPQVHEQVDEVAAQADSLYEWHGGDRG